MKEETTKDTVLEEDIRSFADRFSLASHLQGKHVAVTGATGLLGSCMVRCLIALDRKYGLHLRTTCIVRNEAKARSMFGNDADVIVHDFSRSDSLLQLPPDTDFVIHFASPTASKYFVSNPVETIRTGFDGTEQILEASRRAEVSSVVYVSSLEVYGAVYDDSKPVTEETMGYIDPMNARSSYPMGKRAAECLCKSYSAEYGLPVKVARLAQTFGAGVAADDNRVFAQFARNIINGENIVLHTTGQLSRCYCYTTDAVEGLLYVLLSGTDGEAYNVANESTYISVADMASFLCANFNPALKPVIHLQDGLGYSPVTRLRLSCKKLRALGWQPHYGLKEMFSRLILSLK